MSDAVSRDAAPVVTLGECLVALVGADTGPLADVRTFVRHVAGAEANVAVGLARLGHGVAFIGRVGNDGFGRAIIRRLRGEGVDVSGLSIDPSAPTGLLVRERRQVGPIVVQYYRTGSAGSRLGPMDVEAAAPYFGPGRWLHVTGITPALSVTCREAVEAAVARARAEDMTVSLDVNMRRRLWTEREAAPTLRRLAESADLVLGDRGELAIIAGLDADVDVSVLLSAVIDLGPSHAIVRLGDEGAVGQRRGGTPVHELGPVVHGPIDTIGAGDAFTAGFIASVLESGGIDNAELDRALRGANACGAAAVGAIGDQAGLVDRAELETILGGSDAVR